jgi:acyl dehydratase
MSQLSRTPTVSAQELANRLGQTFISHWIVVDQTRIDAFASVSEDDQFIHVDQERASLTRFGGTIAQGFLTLSLLSPMAYSALPKLECATIGVNYGFNKIRFLQPVRAGSRVRARFTLIAVIQRSDREWQFTYDVVVEIEGERKPAVVASWLIMQVIEEPGSSIPLG